ncbi:ATG13 family [Rhizoctonia solani]|uniref:Autophagy-related protein 13 n=1 Tax=Rhizoctonia solani TaxID=456999 RepID=A0A8H7I504_9AGAM|nr:ATG13 family [Rhizoctonia solani]
MAGRGEQIISRLFVKSALLISDARENQSVRPASGAKPDKWFQLEVMDDGRFGGLTQELRDLGNAASGPLELRVRSILVLGPPSPAQALVLVSDSERRKRVEIPPEARAIQLEEWSLSLDRSTRLDSAQAGEEPYPAVYKQAIALMRSLYAVLRVMVIATLVGREEDALHEEVLALTHKLIPDEGDLITFSFPPIVTPLGAIALRAQYRPNVRFRLDPLESLWSSALATPSSPGGAGTGRGSTSPASPSPPAPKFDLDSPAFTPTLLATRQRASLTGSGSPLRPASRTGTSPGTVAAPLPPRTRTISQLSAGGDTPQSLLTRGSVSGSVTPSGLAPGPPSSPRRTSGTINPFKGATLASSPRTLGMGASPLGGGSPRTTPGLGLGTSPRAGIAVAIGAGTGTSPLSAGAGAGTGSSPRGTESDGRRSMDSGDGTRLNAQPQPIKRYSSSFGHRPGRSESSLGSAGLAGGNGSVGAIAVGSLGAGSTGGAPGSVDAGSTGSGGQGGGAGAGPHSRLSTIGSQSYLSHAADDDDLGQFIKEIDTRPQLGSEGSPLSLDTAISTEQFPLSSPAQEQFPRRTERFPSISPQTERFPPSSLPTTYSALPHLSPLGRTYEQSLQPFGSRPNEGIAQNLTDSPRPLPPPLESVPPSPAESAWQMRSRSRERFGSSERRTSIDNRYGVRGPSTSRERTDEDHVAGSHSCPTGSPSSLFTGSPFITGRTASPFNHERARTTSLTPIHGRSLTPSNERERTISFTRRNRTLLTRRDEVDAEIERMKESFQASYAPASPREPASRGLGLEPTPRIGDGSSGSGSGSGTRRIGSEEVVGRLELGESSGLGFGVRGSVRPGRDTDGWKDGENGTSE